MEQELTAFLEQLVRLNACMKELFESGNAALFAELNAAVKELHKIQHASDETALVAIEPECKIIYSNSDMIVKVLRTTEDGVIDKGAQTALNKFLHNIDEAVVNIVTAFGLV